MSQSLHQIIQARLTSEQVAQVTAHATALGLKPGTYMRLKLLQPDRLGLSPLILIQLQAEVGELSNGIERMQDYLTQLTPLSSSLPNPIVDLNQELQNFRQHLSSLQTQLNHHAR